MPSFRKPTLDTIEHLIAKINDLEQRLQNLENMKTPSVPTYDMLNLPEDSFEGQIAIIENAT